MDILTASWIQILGFVLIVIGVGGFCGATIVLLVELAIGD